MIEPHRNGWPRYYMLVGHTPIAVDMMTWAKAIEERRKSMRDKQEDPWRVALTEINDKCYVSTVFIGLDHTWRHGDPLLFETMTFGGPLDQDQERYSTWEQAERGHAEVVTQARKACAQVDAIAKNAGADEQR
jgi:hypothetical protein